jgi:hypothetical protein
VPPRLPRAGLPAAAAGECRDLHGGLHRRRPADHLPVGRRLLPGHCNNTNDNDCPCPVRQQRARAGETCDPIASCMDRERACVSDAATTRTRMGDPGAASSPASRPRAPAARPTAPAPPAAVPIQDRDCPGCGNGVTEAHETCDPGDRLSGAPGGLPERSEHDPHAVGGSRGLHLRLHRVAPALRPGRFQLPRRLHARPATPTAPAAATGRWIRARPAIPCRCVSRGPPPASATPAPSARPMGDTATCRFTCQETPADVRRRPTCSARPAAAPPGTGTATVAATAASNRARRATRAGPRTSGPASGDRQHRQHPQRQR